MENTASKSTPDKKARASRKHIWQPLLQNSPTYTIIYVAVKAGFPTYPILRLFFLVDINPRLIAHERVFEALGRIFSSDIFSKAPRICLRKWGKDLPLWVRFCHWVTANQQMLATKPGLNRFLSPREPSTHPQNHFGISRHPLPAALWCRYGEDFSNQRDTDLVEIEKNSLGQINYETLLALATFGHITRRASATEPNFFNKYLQNTSEVEFSPSITGIDPVARVLRDCALKNHVGVVAALCPSTDISAFLSSITGRTLPADRVGGLSRGTALLDFEILKNFFKGLRWILDGRPAPIKIERHQSKDQHKTVLERLKHDGFIPASKTVLLSYQEKDDDPDQPVDTGIQVFIVEKERVEKEQQRERSGLAPRESKVPVLKLYHASEIGSAIRQARYQALAIESRNQGLFWDHYYLTNFELRAIDKMLRDTITRYLDGAKSGKDDAQAALILMMVVHFGFSLETARTAESTFDDLVESSETVALRLPRKSKDGITWSIPALSPTYSAKADWNDSLSRQRAERLVLPDYFKIGELIKAYLTKASRDSSKLFSLDPRTAQKKCKALLRSLDMPRVMISKLHNVLPGHLRARNRDPALIWILTWDIASANQSRLYYSRFDTSLLQRLYAKASRSIQNCLGGEVSIQPPLPTIPYSSQGSIGARFVLAPEALQRLVDALLFQLGSRPNRKSTAEIREYHNHFVLYVWLVQSLSTSMRAINNPIELFVTWDSSGGEIAGLADKGSEVQENARLVTFGQTLVHQYRHLREHQQMVEKLFEWPPARNGDEPWTFHVINRKYQPEEITEGWIESALEALGFRIPANFHRAYRRSELIRLHCPAEMIDCFLGHASEGESPFGERSTFDYGLYREMLPQYLHPILRAARITPDKSRLVS